MKKGVEIIPEENYRLRNEDNYTPQQKDFGSRSSAAGSSNGYDPQSTTDSFNNQFPDGYSETHGFREASTTLYARSGDKRVGL